MILCVSVSQFHTICDNFTGQLGAGAAAGIAIAVAVVVIVGICILSVVIIAYIYRYFKEESTKQGAQGNAIIIILAYWPSCWFTDRLKLKLYVCVRAYIQYIYAMS